MGGEEREAPRGGEHWRKQGVGAGTGGDPDRRGLRHSGGGEEGEERAPGVGWGSEGRGACWSGPLTPGLNKGLLEDHHTRKMDGTGASRPFVAGDEREQAL